ncbi:MAG: type IV pilus secretin PilQ [Proteobacteria bacterium]|nr:MAG: type IV pilus secretin PilQ [Pseudomonadota bacterium]
MEGLDVSAESGKVVIKLKLKDALTNPPASFSLTNPPRVAFDLPNTVNALGKNSQDINESDVKSIRIGESAGRSRVVLNLNRSLKYNAAVDGQNVVITLQTPAGASASPSPAEPTHFADNKPAAQPHAVRNIDFRRGRNGEGQVIIDLSDVGTGIDLKQQGRTVTVDLLQTELPLALERRFDVNDFGTPVEFMEATAQGSAAHIVIQARGRWEQSAYQTDNRLIIEVKPIVEQQAQQKKIGYTGEKLSLNFQNVEVRAVLQVIADFTGLNIITSDTVSGNLTLRLKDVPWDQALDIILQAKGLDMRKTGNVVWIAPRDELATKEKLALEAQQQIAELEPLRTESFQLNYQKAEALQKLISDAQQKVLSKRGSAVIDARTNTLFVQDTPTKLEEIRALIKQIDVPVRQVLIESRIVEANDTFNKNLGARLGFNFIGTQAGLGGGKVGFVPGGFTKSIGVQTGQAQNYSESFFPDSYSVNLPAQAINGNAAGQFGFTLFNAAATRFLNLEISALQSDDKGKIISSPRVITADNIEAVIEQGTEIPYQQASSSGATSISFRKATLSLKVKPQITPDDNVIMNLEVHKDSVGANTTAGPSIDTKQVTTQVLVENGGTVSIGGIFTQTQDTTTVKVPLLGDIPIVGSLFKTRSDSNDRRELLIFVTPKIMRDNVSAR